MVAAERHVLPLLRGSSGRAVADLQLRLSKLGLSCEIDPRGAFGEATELAIKGFQAKRGLRVDGVCGRQTWSSVVEAGFSLGDRLLYRRAPMLHGDDVADLQRRLSTLGFDPGGIDGIFGDGTAEALGDFQRNCGLRADAIFGPRTLNELRRFARRPAGDDLVSTVRDRVRVAAGPATLSGRKIAVGETGGFSVGVRAVCRALSEAGAVPVAIQHPDESQQADAANTAEAACYVGLSLNAAHREVRTAYYRGYRYESETSRKLAEIVQELLVKALQLGDGGSAGMALPILRETKMPAVLVELGAPTVVAPRTPLMALAILESLQRWMSVDWERA